MPAEAGRRVAFARGVVVLLPLGERDMAVIWTKLTGLTQHVVITVFTGLLPMIMVEGVRKMEFLILSCRALASAPCSPVSRPGGLLAPRSGCCSGSSSAITAGLGASLGWTGLGGRRGRADSGYTTWTGGRRDANGTAARPVVVVTAQSSSDIASRSTW
ncbi:hypothetical protein EYF80_002199 [Liparis tanakae]|uniref:Uncharacterized protein n=1 Tax=Liparis tanakae TaxID=230148 RepID=A0A4Z2JE18_9TELE|nr:hypothetical protein EYF80_002199 [Liparis tanakae]